MFRRSMSRRCWGWRHWSRTGRRRRWLWVYRVSNLLAAVAMARDVLTDLTSVVEVALARIQDSQC